MKTRLRLRLRECIATYERRTGRPLSYRELSKMTGLSYDTIKKMGSTDYNASLRAVERLCDALGVSPAELLGWPH